jgi:HEAT repeat protein
VISTASRFFTVSQSLGANRFRNEVIPFLLEFLEQDEDEVHTSIARQLGDFADVSTCPIIFYH